MVINRLWFTLRPLYLESYNDDRLGRTLDKPFSYGCDSLFRMPAYKGISSI
ncbi:MAG: hypothetical protein QRY72_02755 [Candidatus Rhabdochlamydia sp.]